MIKRAGIVALLLLVLVGAGIIALPYLLSSETIRKEVSNRLAELTGRTVVLNGASSVSIYPYLQIEFSDVTVSNVASGQGSPLVEMDRLQTRLRLWPILFGRTEVAKFVLIRPRFDLHTTRTGENNWTLSRGLLVKYIDDIRSGGPQVEPPFSISSISIVDGILRYQNDLRRRVTSATSLTLDVDWPSAGGRITIDGNGVWNGEVIDLTAEVFDPARLVIGEQTALNFNLRSKPVNWEYEGSATAQAGFLLDGKITAETPSLRRLLEWTGYPIAAGSSVGAVSISADAVFKPGSARFQNAELMLGSNTGSGVVQLDLPESGKPAISGTLAYDLLDLTEFVPPMPQDGRSVLPDVNTDLSALHDFDLDLRMSATAAKIGTVELANMAATVRMHDARATFDIGDAEVFGGNIQSTFTLRDRDGFPAADLKLRLSNIQLEQFGDLVSKSSTKLIGPGSVSVDVETWGKSRWTWLDRLEGTATIEASSGRVEGLDLAKIAEDAASGPVVDANKVFANGTNFNRLSIGMRISKGTAYLRDTKLEGDEFAAVLHGRTNLHWRSLALNGTVMLLKPGEGDDNPPPVVEAQIPFLIGGTLNSPLIAPDQLRLRPNPKGT
ncbi:MAG: AsmA family protein [Pseudomonadota bacterium]